MDFLEFVQLLEKEIEQMKKSETQEISSDSIMNEIKLLRHEVWKAWFRQKSEIGYKNCQKAKEEFMKMSPEERQNRSSFSILNKIYSKYST